jgi:preprotein translocase subunit SecG
MPVFLIIIHVVVSIALILIVLLQTGKGADMGAAFGGGGSNTLFGASGASTFLGKLTTVAAVVFMLTSLTLAYMTAHRPAASILDHQPAATEPSVPAGEAQTGTKTTDQTPKAQTQTSGDQTTPQKSE